ncbi:MAG: arylsulfotransferase family protein, partial [Anaerolineae bacterium]
SKAPAAEGQDYVFVAPFYWTKTSTGSYLLILNRQGQVVYYQSMVDDLGAFDFKRQPNGLLSYWNQKDLTIYLLDAHYHVVDTYRAGNGYEADLHDFQLLPNGYALLMAYDAQTVDMSKVVLGGKRDATVTGLVIQEIDPSKNVIWEWRSWDHIAFHESTVDLTKQEVDLVHGNALALANDGNLLLSSRNLCEITKIDLQTGEVIWRLGGRANQFRFVGGEPFAYQHDVRQLPNGHITLFDNHGTTEEPAPSYGLEYEIDETTKIATQVWQYEHQPPVFGAYMGNVQRMADGNTFISWGSPFDIPGEALAYVSITEVGQDKGTLFEMAFDEPYVSYRAFLFPWQGFPDTPPALAFRAEGRGLRFGYSWNGATEVASWRLYGGSSAQGLAPIEEKVRADFETQSYLSSVPAGQCYFQVAALDRDGKEMARSEVVSTDSVRCPAVP